MAGPLSHIRVLDMSRVLAGPWAGQNLADLGAEVIKIERPKTGDDSRAFGPPWIKDAQGRDTKDSAYFASANRGKKSITVNLQQPEGQALVRELNGILAHMDVLAAVDTSRPDDGAAVDGDTPLRDDRGPAIPLARAREDFAPAMRDGFFLVPRLSTHEDRGDEAAP